MSYKKVRVFATKTCPYCTMAANWLTEKQIAFEKVLVDENQEEAMRMVKQTGQMGVPVIEIEYEDRKPEYVIGFNKPQLAYMLGVS